MLKLVAGRVFAAYVKTSGGQRVNNTEEMGENPRGGD